MRTDLRGQVGWLIAIRAIISTLLLGGATVAQITAPDSFAVDPFFLLIATTYALTILSAATLGLVERHRWLVDAQLTCDAVVVSAFIFLTGGVTSFFSSLVRTADHRRERDSGATGRTDGGDPERRALYRHRVVAVPAIHHACWRERRGASRRTSGASGRAVRRRHEPVRVLRRGDAQRVDGRKRAGRPACGSSWPRTRSPTCRRSTRT